MDPTSRTRHHRLRPALLLVVLALASGATFGACSGSGHEPTGVNGTGTKPMAGATHHAPADAVDAWANRPAFARGHAPTEEAYAYALFHPEAVAWMPCYCGCGAMGHESNRDCFLKPADGGPTRFEEHGSYCDVCVETALLTKRLVGEGKSLLEIRQAVDRTFGDRAPGTPTELPPG